MFFHEEEWLSQFIRRASGLGNEANLKQDLQQEDRSSPKPLYHLPFKAALGLNLVLTTCPFLCTLRAEQFRGGNLSIHTHHPVCRSALRLSASLLYFSRILKCSLLGERKKKTTTLSLDWSWIVIPQSNVTTSQMSLGSCFPNIVYVYILYTVIKLGFHYLKPSAVSLPPPAVNGKCCSQNSTCHILFSRTGRILRYTGFFPWVHFNMYFV